MLSWWVLSMGMGSRRASKECGIHFMYLLRTSRTCCAACFSWMKRKFESKTFCLLNIRMWNSKCETINWLNLLQSKQKSFFEFEGGVFYVYKVVSKHCKHMVTLLIAYFSELGSAQNSVKWTGPLEQRKVSGRRAYTGCKWYILQHSHTECKICLILSNFLVNKKINKKLIRYKQ